MLGFHINNLMKLICQWYERAYRMRTKTMVSVVYPGQNSCEPIPNQKTLTAHGFFITEFRYLRYSFQHSYVNTEQENFYSVLVWFPTAIKRWSYPVYWPRRSTLATAGISLSSCFLWSNLFGGMMGCCTLTWTLGTHQPLERCHSFKNFNWNGACAFVKRAYSVLGRGRQ